MDKHLEEVDHSIIRYANVWEDPILLIEGLDIKHDHKVLSIASAGDNAFALASERPEIVVAIDLNRPQLYLTELKKVAIAHMEREDYLGFIGFAPSATRLGDYKRLKTSLSGEAQAYWNGNQEMIASGIVLAGKFEKYLKTFARRVLPLIHKSKTTQELFAEKSSADQKFFYDSRWDTWSWRWLFRLFFNKQVMGLFGRDRTFLKQVQVHVSTTILQKAGEHLSSTYAQHNPILYYCLNGHFGADLPYYAKEAHYDCVRENLDRIHIEYGYAQDAVVKYGSFHRYNLSNIFEYMTPEVFAITARSLVESARPGARFAYWNLMVQREISAIIHEVERIPDRENWAERDKGFFYMQYVLEQFQR